MRWQRTNQPHPPPPDGRKITFATCQADDCQRISVWVAIEVPTTDDEGNKGVDFEQPDLVWPAIRRGPNPNADLPNDVRKDYEEARAILEHSPRAAAALLRLALQRLMNELGLPGKDINSDIAALVADGLRADVQEGS